MSWCKKEFRRETEQWQARFNEGRASIRQMEQNLRESAQSLRKHGYMLNGDNAPGRPGRQLRRELRAECTVCI